VCRRTKDVYDDDDEDDVIVCTFYDDILQQMEGDDEKNLCVLWFACVSAAACVASPPLTLSPSTVILKRYLSGVIIPSHNQQSEFRLKK